MKAFDRLLIFITAGGIWALAAMYYMTEFAAAPAIAPPPPPPPAMPSRIGVFNDRDAALKVSGTVDAAITRLNCDVKGKILTQKAGVRLFGTDEWSPDKEWPVELTFECK
ncbi:MAG: hypothetical protein AB7G15_14615 [Alphaproteobacteria bacterium]